MGVRYCFTNGQTIGSIKHEFILTIMPSRAQYAFSFPLVIALAREGANPLREGVMVYFEGVCYKFVCKRRQRLDMFPNQSTSPYRYIGMLR